MKKNFSRILSLVLVAVMALSMTACGKKNELAAEALTYDVAKHDEVSAEVYENVLGEFAEIYAEAKEADSVSEKFALMAVAEAKLMEAAVMLPTNTRGGSFAITRVAPRTVTSTLWGSDVERIHDALVVTEFITAADRDTMKAKWEELKGTGEYEAWAKSFLADNGYTLKDTYTALYTGDPETFDVLASSRATVSDVMVQCYDGLMEYDMENRHVGALAEDFDVSDDGLTYTFKIRKGATWVDSQGSYIADVTADDFVAGMQHMMDAVAGLEYLVQGVIVGANEYINGEIGFDEVGVKAVDEYTLEYTLEAPCSYFTTMLGYSVFAPMNRAYYESQGGQFGEDFDPADASYVYGTTKDNIAYCGPYTITSYTAENSIVFEANESYWDAENINIKKYSMLYDSGKDAAKPYNDAVAGTIDGTGLSNSNIETAKKDGLFDTYAYISDTDATSYMAFYNLNRAAYANVNDATAAVSTKTVEEAERTNTALMNQHFRTAISHALDREAWNATVRGEDVALYSLRNSYTPGTFVTLDEEVTVDINGTATPFAAGTYYGEIMQAQLDADGSAIKVWNAETMSGDGFDGWYNPEVAAAELELAIAELKDAGVKISEKNPIHLELPYPSNDEEYTQKAQVYKTSVEEALGKKVVLDLVACASYDEWYYTGYYTEMGYESNYDIFDLSGWGPDYGDPQTYLDTFLGDYAGYMAKCCGIF